MQANRRSGGALHRLVRNLRANPQRKNKKPCPFTVLSRNGALGRFFREQGLYTLVRWNTLHQPAVCINNEQQLREAVAIIDKWIGNTDKPSSTKAERTQSTLRPSLKS